MNHLDLPYINHMLDVIKDIENSINSLSEKVFKNNKDKIEANIRRIEIISQDIINISNNLKEKYLEVEWKKLEVIKESLTQYFGVDYNIIWNILNKSIPTLKESLIKIKNDLEK